MPEGSDRRIEKAFRPRARLLQLLGDQLIGSAKLAVFELVKNAYDADASKVTITLADLALDEPWIKVEDDGQGMSFETISEVWLVPGDDHRQQQRELERRSPKFNRLPLGEKGLGRFAVHKLGDRIRLATHAKGEKECYVEINWADMMETRFLDDAPVTVIERDPKMFRPTEMGTKIRIDNLKQKEWTRRDVRDLYRQVTSISSPFTSREADFEVELLVPGVQSWITELPDARELLDRAPWRFTFDFSGTELTYKYEFRGVPNIRLEPRTLDASEPLQVLVPEETDDLDPASAPRRRRVPKVVADPSMIEGIGPVSGRLYVFDRDADVLTQYAQSRLIERYLDQNGGVRVYRDDIRIYNYGEPGDDWLGLDLRRVNSPSRNLSRNIVIGAIDIDLQSSKELREKTNREGFVENGAYARLRQLVLGAINVFETERQKDKRGIRALTGKAPSNNRDVAGPIGEVRKVARKHGLLDVIDPSLRRVEEEFRTLREDFLRAGISQVGLAIVFHEVERAIGALGAVFRGDVDIEAVREQVGQLQGVLETSTQLLRKGDKKAHPLQQLVRRARDLSAVRLRAHKVKLTCPVLDREAPEKPIFAFGLALGALTNLIDNAIHWMRVAIPEEDGPVQRRLFIDVVEHAGRPAVIVADNGPGFRDPPAQVVEPFFTRRPDGMGLGLYYANLAMNLNDGELLFPAMDDFDIPEEFSGAIVALVFKEGN